MAVSPHYKHTIVYLSALGGIVSFATYTLVAYEIFPPGLDSPGPNIALGHSAGSRMFGCDRFFRCMGD